MTKTDLASLYESLGAPEFVRRVNELLETREIKPDEISVRGLYEATTKTGIRPVSEAAVDTTAFAGILGNMVFAAMKSAYETASFIGDKLVDTLKSSEPTETVPGTTTPAGPEAVAEGEPYPETGFGALSYETSATKKGRLLWITREAVMRDRTGLILRQAADIGRYIAYERELTILTAIQDLNGAAYKPNGTPATLYSSGNKNVKESNALVDYTNIEAARRILAAMTDDRGRKLLVDPKILLVPDALETTARMIIGAAYIDRTSGESSETGTTSANPFQDRFSILASPLLSSDSDWYLGDFKRQFVWHEVWPLSVERAPDNHPKRFTHDIIAGYKGSYYGGAAAVDCRYVVKCSS